MTDHQGVFTVTMLNVLRADFEQWLAGRGLMIAQIPEEGGALIVVPAEFHFGENP